MHTQFLNTYSIIRCSGAGVHAGVVVSIDRDVVVLKDSTRLWSWEAKDGVALSGVAQHGFKGGKKDTVNPLIYLTGVCEIIPCSDKAEKSLRS